MREIHVYRDPVDFHSIVFTALKYVVLSSVVNVVHEEFLSTILQPK